MSHPNPSTLDGLKPSIPHLVELSIGYAVVACSILVGFETAAREMLVLMENYRG